MSALAARVDEAEIEVWPDNWPAFVLFCDLQSQWRIGMGGPTGLDYNVLLTLLARMRLSDAEHDNLFDDVRVMERAALDAISSRE